MAPRLRDITSSAEHQSLLKAFYEDVFVPQFPDPNERESLENIVAYLVRRESGWYGDNSYHVLVLEEAGCPLAGVICDYFSAPNAGVIEFIVVRAERRGSGLGRDLLVQTESVLNHDALALRGTPLAWIAAEVNDPCAPDLNDNMDPFTRALIWSHWGYRTLLFPYIQPALGSDKSPVTNLMLLGKFLAAQYAVSLPAPVLISFLDAYMRWAMRIDTPASNPQFRSMAEHLRQRKEIPHLALDVYLGYDKERPLTVTDLAPSDESGLHAVVRVYRDVFGTGPTRISPDVFRSVLLRRSEWPRGYFYHLWALRDLPHAPVQGMVSFYTLGQYGFGGYIALTGSLLHTRRLPLIMRRIEIQMCRDSPSVIGCLVECDPRDNSRDLFLRRGFHEIPVDYFQPCLDGPPDPHFANATKLHLLYRGTADSQFDWTSLRSDMPSILADILTYVYEISAPELPHVLAHYAKVLSS